MVGARPRERGGTDPPEPGRSETQLASPQGRHGARRFISSIFRPPTLRAAATDGSATLVERPGSQDARPPIRPARTSEPRPPSSDSLTKDKLPEKHESAPVGPLQSETSSSRSDLGPIELCSGGLVPEVDIFFVHGLNGKAFRTWEKKGFMWPKHLLGHAFPKARIFTYGYEADVVKLFSRVGKNSIFEQSRSLIQGVHRARRDSYQRPIIFVAHSLGGILVKDGLSWAKAQTGFSAVRVNEVFSATKGVIFLGTPHRGASGQYAEVGEQLRRLVDMWQDTNPQLLSSLKSDSETLPRISESFHRLCEDKTFLIFSFVETLPLTTLAGRKFGLVVDSNSGYMGLAREEKDVIPNADHREMVRFSSRDDEGYKRIEDAIRHCIESARLPPDDDGIGGVPALPNKTGSLELIYEFTANSQHLTDIEILRSGRLEGTCEWISEQLSFKDWISGSSKLLLLIGAAGAGKSHVLAKIIDVLDSRYEKPRRGDTSTPLTAYFFCRTPNKKKTLINGLKSMIGQLMYLDEAYSDEVAISWDRYRTYDEDSSPDIHWLWQNLLFSSRALARRSRIFLIVDGLDECDMTERREFLESAYLHCAKGTGPVIQVLCSGRPEVRTDMTQIIDNHFSSLDVPTIELSWQNKGDIESLIAKKMARVKFSKDKKLRARVQEAISSDANGMFLWTDLTLKEFINAKSNMEVESCLQRMKATPNLDDMYHGIMRSLIDEADEFQAQIFRSLLIWLIYGTEVMRYSLLEEAIERTVGTKVFALSDEVERLGSIVEIGGFQRLRLPSAAHGGSDSTWTGSVTGSYSGSSAQDSDDGEDDDDDIWNDDGAGITGDEVVRIRHATFQQWYLDVLDHDSPIWLSSDDAHVSLTITCLDTLIDFADTADQYPKLLDYSRDAWCDHLLRVDWTRAEEAQVIQVLLKLHTLFTDSAVASSWLRLASFIKWIDMKSRLEPALTDLLQRSFTLSEIPEAVRQWARTVFRSIPDLLQGLCDCTLITAESSGFFTRFPGVGAENVDFHLIMRAFLFFFEVAAAKYRVDPSTFLNTSSEKFRSKFWDHSVWKEHPAMKKYAMAEFCDEDDFFQARRDYLDAQNLEPNQPVSHFQLAALYLRQSMHLDAQISVQAAVRLCADKADGRGLGECRLLEAKIHDVKGELAEAVAKYNVAVALGNTAALDMLASHHASVGDALGFQHWFGQYSNFALIKSSSLENTLADAILRQPVFSEWHTQFAAAAALMNPKVMSKAYKRAASLAKEKGEPLLTQCGCRFHLAEACRGSRRAKAIPLWTWTLNNLTRFKSFWENSSDNGVYNRLFTLTIEELSVSQALTLNHPLVSFAENMELSIFDYSRIMIMLGKGIEQQPHLYSDAAQLYRRVLRRVVQMARMTGPVNHHIRIVLGDSLMALRDMKNAARALSWSCIYRDESAGLPPGADPASSEQYGAGDMQQNLQTRISWYILCDLCMAKRSYATSMEIFGYRYKCCACGELDLCEPCYQEWKAATGMGSTGEQESEALRHCSAKHEFLKLPTQDWPEVESESRMILEGKMPASVQPWLDSLDAKFDLQAQR